MARLPRHRVLVADDHQLVRLGVKRLLQDHKDFVVLATARNGEEAVELTTELRPDIILMDVQMPGIGGLEATRRCIRVHAEVKVIAMTVHEDDPYPSRMLKVGAAGYLTKRAGMEELLHAIRTVLAGDKYISAVVAQQMALRPFHTGSTPFDRLSAREMQISLMVIMGSKVQEIAYKLALSPKTVNSYRYRIFEKLGIDSNVALAKLAIQHGMIDPEVAA